MGSDANNNLEMSIGQAAEYIGVSRDTLRRWEQKGKINPKRSPTNRRYYTKTQLDELLKKPSDRQKTPQKKVSEKPTGSLKPVLFALLGVLLAAILGVIFQLFIL